MIKQKRTNRNSHIQPKPHKKQENARGLLQMVCKKEQGEKGSEILTKNSESEKGRE